MKKYIYITLLLLLSGCGKFLEPKSQSEFVPQTAQTLNEMLIGSAYPTSTFSELDRFSEIFSDDVECSEYEFKNPSYNEDYKECLKYVFAWHPRMDEYGENYLQNKSWINYYKLILGCNAALDYIDKVKGTENEITVVKGQAYALRAFYYFMLVNYYGAPYGYNKSALGVPLKMDSGMELDYLSRSTVKEVYERIVEDLNNAEAAFEKLPGDLQFKLDYRISLPAVQLLKSRVFLYMERWDDAVLYAERVIQNWKFTLFNLNSFTPTALQPYYPSFKTYDCPETIWAYGTVSDANNVVGITFYREDNKVFKVFNAAKNLLNLYDLKDRRKDHYIIKESPTIPNYTCHAKLRVKSNHALEYTKCFGKTFRLSEAYLNLAEALVMKSVKDEARAVALLNTLREKRYEEGSDFEVPATHQSGETLLNLIKEERRREMCFEGHRWQDLRRWGMPSFTRIFTPEEEQPLTFTLEKNDPAYTLPIPGFVLEKNRNLIQNPLSKERF